jgi:hypothetical protein
MSYNLPRNLMEVERNWRVVELLGTEILTRSSEISLKALASKTRDRGAIVVYLLVGLTPGTC